MKKVILVLGTLAILAGTAYADGILKPADYRRTLFVPVGQDQLMFEAPKGMCFMDPSKFSESFLYDLSSASFQKKGKEVLLGMFAPCSTIANLGNDHAGGVLSLGYITWANPEIGEKTPLERQDYLDMRESTFRADLLKLLEEHDDVKDEKDAVKESGSKEIRISATAALQSYKVDRDTLVIDETVHRTADGVSLTFSSLVDTGAEKTTKVKIVAATSVRHYPIEFTIGVDPEKDGYDKDKLYALMDKFLAQQIALNE